MAKVEPGPLIKLSRKNVEETSRKGSKDKRDAIKKR